jgi:hypothetical protein
MSKERAALAEGDRWIGAGNLEELRAAPAREDEPRRTEHPTLRQLLEYVCALK